MFETSPTLSAIGPALAQAQGAVEGALKGKENAHFRSNYADLAAVWDACDLCGPYVSEADFDQAALDVTGMNVCPRCLEELADASAINPRSEMGLVGGGDFWGGAANSR